MVQDVTIHNLGELSNCSNTLLGIGTYYTNFNGHTSSITGIAKIYTKCFYFGTEAMLGYAKKYA